MIQHLLTSLVDEFNQNIGKLKERNELFNSKAIEVNNLFNKIFNNN